MLPLTQEEIDDLDVEVSQSMIDYMFELDAQHGLGLPFDGAVQFLKELLLRPGLMDVFLALSSEDQAVVIDNFLYAHENIFDLRGVILFLNICPNQELFTDLAQDIVPTDASISEIRRSFSLENEPFASIPDDLVQKMFNYSRKWLIPDVHAVWIAFSLSNVYGHSALSEILDRALDLKVELSSAHFVKLISDWENLKHFPLNWALEVTNMIHP